MADGCKQVIVKKKNLFEHVLLKQDYNITLQCRHPKTMQSSVVRMKRGVMLDQASENQTRWEWKSGTEKKRCIFICTSVVCKSQDSIVQK